MVVFPGETTYSQTYGEESLPPGFIYRHVALRKEDFKSYLENTDGGKVLMDEDTWRHKVHLSMTGPWEHYLSSHTREPHIILFRKAIGSSTKAAATAAAAKVCNGTTPMESKNTIQVAAPDATCGKASFV